LVTVTAKNSTSPTTLVFQCLFAHFFASKAVKILPTSTVHLGAGRCDGYAWLCPSLAHRQALYHSSLSYPSSYSIELSSSKLYELDAQSNGYLLGQQYLRSVTSQFSFSRLNSPRSIARSCYALHVISSGQVTLSEFPHEFAAQSMQKYVPGRKIVRFPRFDFLTYLSHQVYI
jgi:hypothetical protein